MQPLIEIGRERRRDLWLVYRVKRVNIEEWKLRRNGRRDKLVGTSITFVDCSFLVHFILHCYVSVITTKNCITN